MGILGKALHIAMNEDDGRAHGTLSSTRIFV